MNPIPTSEIAHDVLAFVGLEKVRYARLLLLAVELAVLFLFWIGLRLLLSRLIRRLIFGRVDTARVRTLAGLVESLAQFALSFMFLVSALALLDINVTAILGTASVVGLAVGFGAQKLVKDVMTGFFLLLEDQYAVGDYVTIGSASGTVEEVGMRITRIRDDDGRLYIISNGDIATVCNHSRGPVQGTLDIPLGAMADVAHATEVLDAALKQSQESLGLPKPPVIEGVATAEAAKTVLRIGFIAPTNQRPVQVSLKLREVARVALTDAGIPLG
ncbi:MAG: mechanosensitive ion channel [Armatimonas sp.]